MRCLAALRRALKPALDWPSFAQGVLRRARKPPPRPWMARPRPLRPGPRQPPAEKAPPTCQTIAPIDIDGALILTTRFRPPAAAGDQLELGFGSGDANAQAPTSGRSRWSWLLSHVFRADLDTCSLCGGSMRWLEATTEQTAIARLLAKHGLAPQPPQTLAKNDPVSLGRTDPLG